MTIEDMKSVLLDMGVSEEDFEAVRAEFPEEVRAEFSEEELEQIDSMMAFGHSVDSAIQSLFI